MRVVARSGHLPGRAFTFREVKVIVTAWSNGSGSFGLKIGVGDRDKFFKREWKTVFLQFAGAQTEIEVNIDKPSFWSPTCRELIHHEIGRWFEMNGFVPWSRHKPPKLILEPISARHFRLQISK